MLARPAVLAAGISLALAACARDSAAPLSPEVAPSAAVAATPQGAPIKDQYIVVFKAGASPRAAAAAMGVAPLHVYHAALNGFAARLNPAQLAALRNNPQVDYISPDQLVTADGTQAYPTWGLDRIDQQYLPLNSSYTYNRTGAGINLYVLDTGIRFTHTEFGGRAVPGYDVFGGNGSDCNGHGTHVAGTAGGGTYGVAKAVNLISVRVLDCTGNGATSGVIAGVDWVTANHVGLSVANMSLGGGANTALDNAVQNSINSGVTYVIAAGNNGANACNYSPSRVTNAIIVGNTTSTDARNSTSNYGLCLDLFAPGTNITSAWYGSDTQTNVLTGTSMAAPHVAGIAAMYLEYNPGALPVDVQYAIDQNATNGVVGSPGNNSPNRIVWSGFIPAPAGGGGGGGTPLSVSVFCDESTSSCDATASGGSGSGYSFTWTNVDEQYDSGGYSWGYVVWGLANQRYVSATVTDGNGATATASTIIYRPSGGGGGIQP
ncbi:S8 family peptidase [Longimicrobium sp.]|uniref:S8 family peptidase n=1 Tax=Longimicrobium sp. TaxID=2029185 RepID=UPI002C700767|nr:S8 family peptidase [Longimicrobium sp.]HSU16533.1 S8 family peptidase [Longimicrobium sp.]